MRAIVTVMPSLEDQKKAGDKDLIDPQRLVLPLTPLPLFRNSSYRIPEDIAGTVHNLWVEGGELMADIEISGFSIGYVAILARPDDPEDRDRLVDVSMISKPKVAG